MRAVVERSLTFAGDPSSPSAARRLLRGVLDDCGRADWRDAAELALTELATNVVLHAHSEMTVRISCVFDYDVHAAVDGGRTAIVIDAQNRILGISGTLAAKIGWNVDDLVGRRVVAIVPPQFREAHVAGLTRHLSTGQAHAMQVDLQLPVLCADGTELLCDFWIEADRSRSGQPVYIAYVSPAQVRA